VQNSNVQARPIRRVPRQAGPQVVLAIAAVGGAVLLAHNLRFDEPHSFDRRARSLAARLPPETARMLSPLFPLGLPGGYITIAYALSYWLRRKRRAGGPAIVTSAWLGWLVQRGVKVFYFRERPLRPGVRRRTDSYPSGHTTGTTAFALTSAYVLHRQRMLSTGGAMAVAIGAPMLMGAYRIIADDHWTTDVVGGWLVGGAIALTCNAILADAVRVPGAKRPTVRRRVRRERTTS
jgi:membrane-associated phospholipid phosphatase